MIPKINLTSAQEGAPPADARVLRLLEAAIQQLPAGVALVEAPSGTVSFKNGEADRIFGVTPGALRVGSVADYGQYAGYRVDGAAYQPHEWPAARSLATGEIVTSEEAEIVRGDGTRGYIRMSSAPVRDQAGEVIAALVTYYDISSQKAFEAELRRTAEAEHSARSAAESTHAETELLFRLSDAANRSPDLSTVFDVALDTILQLLRVDRASVVLFDADGVMRFKAWRGLSDEYRAAVEGHSPWKKGDRDAKPILIDDVERSADVGDYLPIFRREEIRAIGFVPLVYGDELLGKFMIYSRHVCAFSVRQRGLAQTVAAQVSSAVGRAASAAAAAEANRRKDEFLAMLGHELRNPLAAIHSALSVIRQAPRSDIGGRALGVIGRQASALTRIVDDLLDVGRITRGLIELKVEPLDGGAIIAGALDAVSELMAQKAHDVRVERPESPVTVLGDRVRLEQVLINLLINAAKYTHPRGTIRIGVSTQGEFAEFRVSDSGVGLDAEMLDQVFELFQQAPTSPDRPQGGLGVGLTVARRLVEFHGGSIRALSAGRGMGTQVVFTIPLAPTASRSAESFDAPKASRPVRVLLVDDHADSREMLSILLRSWGHIVHAAPDGHTGLQIADESQPDVAFLDIGLPGLDGYEIARQLRQRPALQRVVLAAVTGYGQDSDKRRSAAAGFTHHLVKPVTPEGLLRVIESVTGRSDFSSPAGAASGRPLPQA
jgi:signal transduction histidine kinase/ActR/RegA family two-component response regulator